MKRYLIFLILAALSCTTIAWGQNNEDDYDESIRMPVRRLHPEREREKARKKLQQELDAKSKAQQATAIDGWNDETTNNKKKDKRRIVGTAPIQQSSNNDKTLLNELLSKDYSLKQYVASDPVALRWKDDPVTETENELLMQVSKSSPQSGTVRYMPQGVTMSRTDNEFYAYFTSHDAQIEPLRIRVQYYADDPLNFNDIQFLIDGFEYSYHALSPQRGKGNGRMIWEQSDQAIHSSEKDLIYALSHAQWVRMSLVGADGTKHVKMLTKKQIQDFYCILQLYRLMGGTID